MSEMRQEHNLTRQLLRLIKEKALGFVVKEQSVLNETQAVCPAEPQQLGRHLERVNADGRDAQQWKNGE